MRQNAISFSSQQLTLEGVVSVPQGGPGRYPAVVVCHPHPVFQGDMDHPLVLAVCTALDQRGLATLRFNFRGVGRSEGEFTNGQKELEDVQAALKVASHWLGLNRRRMGLVGYSFGAAVILRGLSRLKNPKALVLISPPPTAVEVGPPRRDQRPRLFLVGDADRISPAERLGEVVASLAGSPELRIVPGVDHTWSGREAEAAEHTALFLSRALM